MVERLPNDEDVASFKPLLFFFIWAYYYKKSGISALEPENATANTS